jgi:hypothetical protein
MQRNSCLFGRIVGESSLLTGLKNSLMTLDFKKFLITPGYEYSVPFKSIKI